MKRRFFLGAIASCVVPLPVPVPEAVPGVVVWKGRSVGMTTMQFAEAVRPSFEETIMRQLAASLAIPVPMLLGSPATSYSAARLVTNRAERERLLGSGSWPFSGEGP